MRYRFPRRLRPRLPIGPNTLYKLIGIMFVPFVLLAFYFNFETSAPPVPLETAPTELYATESNHDLTQILATAINNAQESVLLMVFSLTDSTVLKALRNKAESGIPVRVITDAKTSPGVEDRLGPKVSLLKRYGEGLMHLKILVTDHKQVFLGSANMTSSSLKQYGNLVTAIDSPEMASIIEQKANVLQYDGSGTLLGEFDFDVGGQKIELWFLPDHKDAVYRIQKLIDNARNTIRIAMFTWTRRDLAQSIIAAKKRGVDVQVVIDSQSGKGASAHIVKLLKNNGIDARLSPAGPLLHHKFMYIDSTTLVNGSANWTRAAFKQNNDCFIVIENLSHSEIGLMDQVWAKIYEESLPAR